MQVEREVRPPVDAPARSRSVVRDMSGSAAVSGTPRVILGGVLTSVLAFAVAFGLALGASRLRSVAGLAGLVRMTSLRRDAAFAHFHDRFKDDPLVLDKWMSLQASSPLPDTVERVRALTKHPAYDVKNPNRVRALVGAFSGNHLRFHASDGKGYALVG